MAIVSNAEKLLNAQADCHCAVMKVMHAIGQMHTATLTEHRQQRILAQVAEAQLQEAIGLLRSATKNLQKTPYRPRKPKKDLNKPKDPRATMRALERRSARGVLNG